MKGEKIIFFTKAPKKGFGKSRLKSFLSDDEILSLNRKLICENYEVLKNSKREVEIFYQGDEEDLYFIDGKKIPQTGDGLGQRMFEAIKKSLSGCQKVILMGSDLISVSEKLIDDLFEKLDFYDVVISPAKDGGYGIIGMKKAHDVFSGIRYSTYDVFEDTVKKIKNLNLTYYKSRCICDVDEPIDLVKAELKTEDVSLLGYGEYNINFLVKKDFVLRVNMKSQMDLKDQIGYEYRALKHLEKSKVTPEVYEVVKNPKYLFHPYLTMKYLHGRPLDYDRDMDKAAFLLSSVHNTDIEGADLISVKKPFLAMYEECTNMFSFYEKWEKNDSGTEKHIKYLIESARKMGIDDDIKNPCIINTELNNKNFIIGEEKSYIIDWEKPLIGECEQDLAHFTVPTTTAWKTDKILTKAEIESFLSHYEKYRKIDRMRFAKYTVFNILRGITWCSMAKVEYENQRQISNPDTYKKINLFLSEEFLNFLDENYFK